MSGLLALVGGAEFTPGNEVQDRHLISAAPRGQAFVVSTAAARRGRREAVGNARRWFAALGLTLDELPALTRRAAADSHLADCARGGALFYLLGGDPGLVPAVLRDSAVWRAIVDAWRGGAVLAGSSAGAMGLCEHVLVRASWPDRSTRRIAPGLGLVPGCLVIPHLDGFGATWVSSVEPYGPLAPVALGIDERTAAIWDGACWRVEGPGRVLVLMKGSRQLGRSGDVLTGVPEPAPG